MARKVGERMILKQFFIGPVLFKRLRQFADNHNSSVSRVIRYSIERFLYAAVCSPILQQTMWDDYKEFIQGLNLENRASGAVQNEVKKG